jgi:predicted nuclease of predicted toxin-antitoxin system
MELRSRRHEVFRASEVGLRGRSDEEVFAYALANSCVLLTSDRGFGNPKRHPIWAPHPGVMIAQFPNEVPNAIVDRELLKVIDTIDLSSLESYLVIVEAGQFRRKKPKQP